ncbi:MAG: hypothetical protein ACRC8S_00775 [Fimbriiglobus sp.]
MTREVVLSKKAELQLETALEWWQNRSSLQLRKFRLSMARLIENIRQTPEFYPVFESDIREAYEAKYGYSVFFRADDVSVRIYWILHHSQNRDDLSKKIPKS